MAATANFPIKVNVDDAQMKAFSTSTQSMLKALADLMAKLGGSTKEAFTAASKATQDSTRAATAAITASLKEVSEAKSNATKQSISDDEKAAAAMERNIERELKEQAKAQKQIDDYLEKQRKAKEKAAADAEKAAQREVATAEKAAQKEAAARAKTTKQAEKDAQKKAADAEKASQKAQAATAKEVAEKEKAAKKEAALAQAPLKASHAIEEQEKKLNALEIKYSKDKHDHLSKDIKELQAESATAARAMASATEKEVQEEIKARKKAVDEEIKLLQQVQKKKKEEEGGGGHGHHEGAVEHGFKEGLGFGVAIEGLHLLKEKSEEAVQAQKQLQAGTGLSGKELEETGKKAEEIGDEFAVSGETAKIAMGKVASYTGATGEELNKQTEAVIAYSQAHGKSAEMVAKMLSSEQGRAKIMSEANLNIAKAQQAASTPAANMERIEHKLTETLGQVAMTTLNALGPALQAVTPILGSLGELVTSVVQPAMEALNPIMKLIAEQFTKLAPVIISLVQDALQILTPIVSALGDVLGALIPPIIQVIGTIAQSLQPVFKALTPIIVQVATIVKEILVAHINEFTTLLNDVVVPIIRDLVAPILLSLMPLFKMLADLLQQLVVPAVQLLSGGMQWLMNNVVQPLIKWLSGGLVGAIKGVVGVVTEAIQAVSKITSALGSLLGLGGDEAVAATKKTGEAVAEQDKENAQMLEAQHQQQALKEAQEHKKTLMEHLKIGKLSAKEEQELREIAQEDSNEVLLNQLDKFDEKKRKQGETAAKKERKSKEELAKAASDEELNDLKDAIAAKDQTEKQAKVQEVAAEIQHATELKDIALKFHGEKSKQYQHANSQLLKLQREAKKAERDETIAQNQESTNDALAQLENRALQEKWSDKRLADEKYKIQHDALVQEIELRKSWGQDVSKLNTQLASMELKEQSDLNKRKLDLDKELDQNKFTQRKEEIEHLKAIGASERQIAEAETQLAIDEENARWKEEQDKRRADIESNNALKESLEQNHQNKILAIQDKARQEQNKQFEKLAAPFTQAFGNMEKLAEDKLFTPLTKKWNLQKTVAGQALATIAQGFIQMGEQWIIQQGLMLAKNLIVTAVTAATTSAAMDTIAASAAPAAAAVSIASLGAGDVSGASSLVAALGAMGGAFKAFKPLAEGGILTGPTFARGFLGGEAGPELVAPLWKLPEILPRIMPSSALGSHAVNQSGELVQEFRSMHAEMKAMHQTFKQRPDPIIQDMNKTQLSLNQAQLRVQRAKI